MERLHACGRIHGLLFLSEQFRKITTKQHQKMASSNFVDYVKIFCRSGHGGPGSAHLRHEKFVEKGGPDGGDGGRGGHVIVRGNAQYWTLIHLKFARHVFAKDGEGGGKQRSFGRDGADAYIEVPLGTVAKNADTGEVLFEITEDKEERILAAAGWATGISARPRSRRRALRSRARTARSWPWCWNSRCLPMWALWASPTQASRRC